MGTALVVAIDGPAGAGKSSTSRGVAAQFSLAYLDTGAMYRAMTWALLQAGVDVSDVDAVSAAAERVKLVSGTDPAAPAIEANGIDVAGPIRSAEVTAAVSAVSAVPHVRELLVELQRSIIGSSNGIVVEGRDIGSTVVPDARVKIYLVADAEARAARRTAELGGSVTAVGSTKEALARRDHKDSTRASSPLARADDAVVIDSTFLTLEEVISQVAELVAAAP